jgi:hypothetical protein
MATKGSAGFINPKYIPKVFKAIEPITASTGHVISQCPKTERYNLKDKDGRLLISTCSIADCKATVRINEEKALLKAGAAPAFAAESVKAITFSDAAVEKAKAAALATTAKE